MIFWNSDFFRFLIFVFPILIYYFQCMLSDINLEIIHKFDHWNETSKPSNLVRKNCFVLILQRIDISSLTNPYNHIKTNYKTLRFFLGETQINRILAPCHIWKLGHTCRVFHVIDSWKFCACNWYLSSLVSFCASD